MRRFLLFFPIALSVLLSAGLSTAFAQGEMHTMLHSQEPEAIYENALDDWHDGNYPDALHAFKHLLEGPEADRWFRSIALQTGELYRVTRLSRDGSSIRFGPEGRYALYELEEEGETRTYLHDTDAGSLAARIEGEDVMVLENGSVLFRRVEENEAVRQARTERDRVVEEAQEAGNYDRLREAYRAYSAVEIANTRLMMKSSPDAPARDITPENHIVGDVVPAPGDALYMTAMHQDEDFTNVYSYHPESGELEPLTDTHGFLGDLHSIDSGNKLVFHYNQFNSLNPPDTVNAEMYGWTGILNLETSRTHLVEGEVVDVGQVGGTVLLSKEMRDSVSLITVDAMDQNREHEIISTEADLRDPELSPNGTKVAYALQEGDDFEIYAHDADGNNRRRVTRELQHDRFPMFLDENRLIAAKGESRHRRSFMYDLQGGDPVKLFHNNTLRTVAMEYQWAVSPSGDRILIVADRDGDTISPERGVYLLDLNRQISPEELMARIERNMEREEALREKGQRLFDPIADEVSRVTGQASIRRIYEYQKELFEFDSKYITQPGNDRAAEYIYETYASFGYEPEYQWFNPGSGTYGGKTANVIARLEGTVNPELVYVISSHYDSVERGPGADDNSSGTAALLEAARVLADNPMPFTIVFAAFTGEEAGLLGSREYVRRAQENGTNIAGALNNDMIGFANNSRLDNTIRYSNAGIRDIQHAAGFLFTDLVTYDSHYYQYTDAHAYYEAYGDIVGGIGSYPILASPYYHQPNDDLVTINHRLVTEVAKNTIATIMLLASSPSRLTGLSAEPAEGDGYRLNWDPAPESDVDRYLLEYRNADGETDSLTVTQPEAVLENLAPDTEVRVKSLSERGLEGWDWARIAIE